MRSVASTPLSRAEERVGAVLKGKWHLDAVIGVGGMASVFSATHRNGSRVAIKVLNAEYAAQPEFVARFMREGYVANKIDHPASVLVIDDDTDDGCAFLVMELLSGHSLERYARRGGKRLPLGEIMRVSEQVLDLLSVAHGHGILHRDIKPANIHVTQDGKIKVLDFGIARLAERIGDAAATQTGAALGTPSYMPPEQARGRWNMVDPRTDLWALGATMHALIVGERPRRAETVQEEMLLAMTAPLTSLRDSAPGTPPAVISFVERTTAFEMEARWPDASTMQHALRELVALLSGSEAPAFPGHTVPPSSMPSVGAEPGSASGPRVDTAGMVFPASRVEGDPSTLHATEHTAPPVGARSRGALVVGIMAGALTVGLGIGVRALLHTPRPVQAATSFDDTRRSSASPPGVAAIPSPPIQPPLAPIPPPQAAALPAPPSPPSTETAPAPVIIEIEEPAPTKAPTEVAPTSPHVSAPSDSAAPHRAKPKKPASSSLFDERF